MARITRCKLQNILFQCPLTSRPGAGSWDEKYGRCVFCFSYFGSLHRDVHLKEAGLSWFCKTVTCWNIAVTSTTRNEKVAALPRRQKDISHICVLVLQCKPSGTVSASSLCKNWSSESIKEQKAVSQNFGCSRSVKPPCSTRTSRPWGHFFSYSDIF